MNRFRLIEKLKREIKNINKEKPVNYFLEGGNNAKGHFFEVLPYLELQEKGYLIQYYILEVFFSNAGLHVQTYHMDHRSANAKYVTDDDIFKKSISNRMYARMKYLEKSKGYNLLKTSGNDTVLLENIPIFSDKDGLSQDQIIGYDLTLKYIPDENYIEVIEENKPLLDMKIYNQENKRGIYIGGRSLIECPVMNERMLVEHFIPTFLTNPITEIYGKFLNLHNKDAHLFFKDSLLYSAYKVFLEEYFFGIDIIESNPEGFNFSPMEKPEEENHIMPCAYSSGYNDGTPVGSLVNPDTGEEVKIVANSTSIIRQENPGNIFRDHLEKGPIKEGVSLRNNEEEKPFKVDPEYPYMVDGIGYGFKTEMEADLFELLLDEIAQLEAAEMVRIMKEIKIRKLFKEEK